jgi:hydroxymethylbilane synthase
LNTRFKKLDEDGHFDAIILAVAGLKRLNFEDRITSVSSLF